MSEPIEAVSASFREAITKAIVPLQTVHVVKADEFDRLERIAADLAVLLKGRELVSKSLLNEFYVSVRVLRNEAPYCGSGRNRVEAAAQKIEHYLGLILKNESPEQRVPGVPRIT
jgi:hypothetical protein